MKNTQTFKQQINTALIQIGKGCAALVITGFLMHSCSGNSEYDHSNTIDTCVKVGNSKASCYNTFRTIK